MVEWAMPHTDYLRLLTSRAIADQVRAEELRRLLAEYHVTEPAAGGSRTLPLSLALALLSECARLAVNIVVTLADIEQLALLAASDAVEQSTPHH